MLLQVALAVLAFFSEGHGAPIEEYCTWTEKEIEAGDNCCYNPLYYYDETSEESSGSTSEETSEESSGSKSDETSEESSDSKSEEISKESSDHKTEETSEESSVSKSKESSKESSDSTTDKSLKDSSSIQKNERSGNLSERKKRKTSKHSLKFELENTSSNNSQNKALASKHFNLSAFEAALNYFHSLNISSFLKDVSSDVDTSESNEDESSEEDSDESSEEDNDESSESSESSKKENDESSEEDNDESSESSENTSKTGESNEIEECYEKYNSSSKDTQFYSLNECKEECIYEKIGYLTENKTLVLETFIELYNEVLEEFTDWIEPITKATKFCLNYASKKLKPDSPCNSGSAQFEHCILRKEFLICPENYWNNTDICEGIKKKLKSCPSLVPPSEE